MSGCRGGSFRPCMGRRNPRSYLSYVVASRMRGSAAARIVEASQKSLSRSCGPYLFKPGPESATGMAPWISSDSGLKIVSEMAVPTVFQAVLVAVDETDCIRSRRLLSVPKPHIDSVVHQDGAEELLSSV